MSKSKTNELKGRCLCGKCTYLATPKHMEASVCHCESCRRWGGVLFSVDVGNSVHSVEGPTQTYASSPHMNRISCRICSAPLFREVIGQDQYYAVMHCFDDPSAFDFSLEIFINEKPANYDLKGDHPRLTADQFWQMQAKTST